MDDIDRLRRRRTIKVLITDLFMATCVVAIVLILVAVVAGWRIGEGFKVEQNGLVSIKTKPTGASVIIDDELQYQASNMSKMLPGGTHKVVLEKDGYERWEKEIKVTPGWLLRLEYPRLIKQDRTRTKIREFETLNFFYASPDRTTAILSEDNSTSWTLVTDLNAKPKFKHIDVQGIFSSTDEGTFDLEIKSIEWNKNDEKILINVKNSDVDEWGIIDLKSVKDSINLSNNYSRYEANSEIVLAAAKKSNTKIVQAKFENEAGDKVVSIVGNNLVRIDLASKTISEPIAKDAEEFKLFDQYVVFKTKFEEGNSYLKIIRLGDRNPTIVTVNSDKHAVISFSLTRFNSTSYILYTINNRLFVYKATDFPSGGGRLNMKPIIDQTVGIISSEAATSFNKEFITLREGSRVIVFDTELELFHEYDYGDEKVRFLDNFMLYRVDTATGTFLTWDFDSTNLRTLVVDKAVNDFDALITGNNKFFYYIATSTYEDETGKENSGFALIQETL